GDRPKKFGLAEGQRTAETCIIIVELEAEGETATMGALVDGVREVLDIAPDRIEAAPRLGSRIDTRFINGIGKLAEGFVILLDIQAIFSDRELSMIADIQQTEQQGAE
ncbi:MAG: chemotaxis protein CheW, partial [Thermodesulfobacteriota bacterium]